MVCDLVVVVCVVEDYMIYIKCVLFEIVVVEVWLEILLWWIDGGNIV